MTDAASPSDQRHEIETDAHQEEQILELKRISLGIVQEEFEQSTNTRHALDRAKRRIQVTLRDTVLQHQERFVSNSDLIRWVDETDLELIDLDRLTRKHTRTLSGICVIAVMTSPEFCPHGTCIYCPGGPVMQSPQSYTGLEPAARRGSRNNYDSFAQCRERLIQLQRIGHNTEKVEIIVMGGTFTARPVEYQRAFVKGIYDALNGTVAPSLEQAIESNMTAHNRCVGLTLETRPSGLTPEVLNPMLGYGTTRCEIGVQIIDDPILRSVNRGHTVADIIQASRALKEAGFKLGYHLMPNLPGASPAQDLRLFQRLFQDQAFQPDFLKIYPTLVLRHTGLFKLWEREVYHPYPLEELIELLAQMLQSVPPYVRVHRIQRDIPASQIVAGCQRSNLYELVMRYMEQNGMNCRCIRCREVGYRPGKVTMITPHEQRYRSSEGIEYFLSLEGDNDSIISYLRLRFDQNATVRELRTVGRVVGIDRSGSEFQHRGGGRQLLQRAEELSKLEGYPRLRVISGIGVREYYQKLGYVLDRIEDPGFMIKTLNT